MIGVGFVYGIAGLVFAAYAIASALGRRWTNAIFWGLLAVSFLFGDRLGDIGNGLLVLVLVGTALVKLKRPADPAPRSDAKLNGNRLFLPALIVPAFALIGTLLLRDSRWIDPKQVTLVSLAFGVIVGLAFTMLWLRPRLGEPMTAGLRLMDSVSWAAVMPQLLAALGGVFAAAGVGGLMGQLLGHLIPSGSLIAAVAVYGLGMALLTMAVGNAFAAFPVMMAAVGLPLLIHAHHGNPAPIAAIGMLLGFCGTLLTPMAANFNLVPTALLELRDRYAVIRAQAPTALILLGINLLFLYWLAFPR
jgi:uncharacterized membrane protein